MTDYYIRVWQKANIESIKEHLLIVGELTGDCAQCREIGLKVAEVKQCPKCGTTFNFMAARSAGTTRSMGLLVKRMKERRPDLTFIDYGDFHAITGKKSARDFFR
jgi:hypothetical protein